MPQGSILSMEHNQLAVDDYLGPLNIPMILVLLRFHFSLTAENTISLKFCE